MGINIKLLFLCVAILALIGTIDCYPGKSRPYPESWYRGDANATMNNVMVLKEKAWENCAEHGQCPVASLKKSSGAKCVDGYAGEYECSNIDLLSFVPLRDLGCVKNGAVKDGNDIWGWTDPKTKKEYAIFCCYTGTSFVDVTDPHNPVVVGFMNTNDVSQGSNWRDAKVYKDHVYVVSEEPGHGMQVFDLTRLRDATGQTFKPDYRYASMNLGSVHNMVINEQSGFGYAVGSKTCSGGLHMIDLNEPKKPIFKGCFASDGYTHDAQCVIYDGPDTRYTGKEICFNYNENTITIVDVSDKSNPIMLSRTTYEGHKYTHQGWLLADSKHLLANDELDEVAGTSGPHGKKGSTTRTMKWNVESLTEPYLVGSFISTKTSIDHNLYIIGDLAYLANYCSGLRILDVSDIEKAHEVAFFDVSPTCDTNNFLGSWSSYPYFESKTIVVSSIERGLFVLKHTQ